VSVTAAQVYKGGASLWLSLGPTTMVEDAVTNGLQRATPIESRTQITELASAAASGAVAAVLVTSQVEHLITAAHAKQTPMLATGRELLRSKGLPHLLLPPGMMMMVLREVPFAVALFHIRPALTKYVREGSVDPSTLGARFRQELFCGCATAAVASPVSHVPSVIAAYQQGHGVSLREAVRSLLAAGGWTQLWRGLGARTLSLAGTMTVVPVVAEVLSGL
jgi:hypothetical protein